MIIYYYDDEFQTDLYVNQESISISPISRGFQYGAGFFETLKFEHHKFYFLKEHVNRLKKSLKEFGYKLPELDFLQILEKLNSLNKIHCNARFKIIAFEGANKKISVLIIPQALSKDKLPRDLSLKQINPSILRRHKSLNYFENIYLNKTARQNNIDDFLYIDSNKNVLETSFANVFFAKNKEIHTPSLNLNILPGIIRDKLITENPFENFEIIERDINVDELDTFEYVFLTNSINGIFPVKSIDNLEYSINNKWLKLNF